jgi:hypothetical protein
MIELSSDPTGGIKGVEEVPVAGIPLPQPTGYETQDYRLVTTINLTGVRVYQIVNVRFGITEYEDHLLSRILNMMQDIQAELDKSVTKYVPNFLTLVEKHDEEGEPSIH